MVEPDGQLSHKGCTAEIEIQRIRWKRAAMTGPVLRSGTQLIAERRAPVIVSADWCRNTRIDLTIERIRLRSEGSRQSPLGPAFSLLPTLH
jgi:hypothetical protein